MYLDKFFRPRGPAIWIATKCFHFWAINIPYPSGIRTHRGRVSSVIRPALYLQATMAGLCSLMWFDIFSIGSCLQVIFWNSVTWFLNFQVWLGHNQGDPAVGCYDHHHRLLLRRRLHVDQRIGKGSFRAPLFCLYCITLGIWIPAIWILNFLKFGFQMVWYSNCRFVCFVLCTRLTIWIPDQYSTWENKMASICLVFKWSGCPVYKWHLNTRPFGIFSTFEYLTSWLIRSPLYFIFVILQFRIGAFTELTG